MIDIGKVANLLSLEVIAILEEVATLKAPKEPLKKHFWAEIYQALKSIRGEKAEKMKLHLRTVGIDVSGTFWRRNNEVPQSEGKQMVMVPQDVPNTLEDAAYKSQISNPFTITTDGDAEMDDDDDDEDVDEDEDENKDEGGSEEEEDVNSDAEDDLALGLDHLPLSASNTGRQSRCIPQRGLPSPSNCVSKADIECAENDSGLGDNELDNDVDILSGDTYIMNDEEGEGEDDEEDEECLRKGKRKDWSKLLRPEEALYGKEDTDKAEEVDGFFTIKHKLDVNEAEVLDMSKVPFDEREMENWEDEELLESTRGLFITIEGFRPGMYVRIVEHFNPHYPMIIGGLLATEERPVYVQAQIKQHVQWFCITRSIRIDGVVREIRVAAVAINEDNNDTHVFKHLENGEYDLVYASPECLLQNQAFKQAFRREDFQSHMVAAVVDEAHVIQAWKDDFCKDYGKLMNLQIIMGTEIPWLALTATASTKTFETIYSTLRMGQERPFYGIGLGSDRPNLAQWVCPMEYSTTSMHDLFAFIPTSPISPQDFNKYSKRLVKHATK
ncbi:hypothetical protein AN958_08394 [Leucoagaricus sp. SymC.cos]|nr:hypothetical protein AN958_08394 [Leucoagaricus sp. SymC.cos]